MDTLRPLEVIEIFNAPGATTAIATKYCITKGIVAKIKGGTGEFTKIIADYKYQNLAALILRGFGYDKHFKQFKAFKLY